MYMHNELLFFYENITHDVDIIINTFIFAKLHTNVHEQAHEDSSNETNPLKQVYCCLDLITFLTYILL